ncbi:serine/threonine-protein kinase [Streptomyces turgidiscabies]|uniref:non-specific serine/threonine protein kinase n=1 Tax=Streptomyces turgidiscabies (strain Car8) TaxID=698760 RepID=L7ETY7_STRT8|nr:MULTISPECIES: serine/threonine-protein kinase [Streptomyces]ELP62349.1 kinase domain protein [Streptomyces turgidiscabies Car8]MDX3499152.1 serine/threonine-protein kinase [Streptomyces turgidiscabies]GAQ75578.1 serine/threonine-protein kinase PknA [Streptomyces turgidiscabies]
MQGQLLAGRYRLVDVIGSGGMGRVWRAHDELLHRAVAVKELTAALYVSESEQAVLLARTRAEARAAARINHSAVVTLHDVLDHDGRPWIVMELVEGNSLADAVKEAGRVEPREAARIGLWVLRALTAAHAAGVLHRDIKPGNVLLSQDGRVLLTDFGIAQVEGDTTITRTGEIVGSVDYLAPERLRGDDPGPSSDLWALGATLYTAVEGRSPFRRTSPLTTMQAVVEDEPAELRYAGPLGPVITALLLKDPAVRPGAAEAEQMLAEAAEGRRPRAAEQYVPTLRSRSVRAPAEGEVGSFRIGGAAAGSTTAQQGTVVGPGAPGRPRRRGRTIALVAALVVLVGVGGAVGLHQWNSRSQEVGSDIAATPSVSASDAASATPSATSTAATDVPEGWARVVDPAGFSLPLPQGWTRTVTNGQIDYTPDGGKHFLRIAIDKDPDFDDPYLHQLDLELQLKRLSEYSRVSLESNIYRDRKGALWDFTWTALAKDSEFPGPRRAIEQAYLGRDGAEYVIYMSAPAADWATAREQFTTVLRGWRPNSG